MKDKLKDFTVLPLSIQKLFLKLVDPIIESLLFILMFILIFLRFWV